MSLIQCPECGKEVSDKAQCCVNCGAPINQKNGLIYIKCSNIDGNPYKVKIINKKTGEEIIRVPQREVVSFEIKEDTTIEIKYPLTRTITYDLKYEGVQYYQIAKSNSFFKLAINRITHIDSD